MVDLAWPLIGLFLLAFTAATLLPGGSEAGLLAMAALSQYSNLTLLVVASTGNILGSVMNYGLGRMALRYQDRKWFPVSSSKLAKAQTWYARWGKWSVLMAWVPLFGDALTVVAGVMRMQVALFVLFVTLAKTSRYLIVLLIFELLTQDGTAGAHSSAAPPLIPPVHAFMQCPC